MYVNAKQRTNKKDVKVFYIYLCESNRIEGKVVNTQRYVGSIKEDALQEEDYTSLKEKLEELTDEEIKIVMEKLDNLK